MARLFAAGAEIEAGVSSGGPEGLGLGGTPTRDTVVFRAAPGVASWKYDSGATNLSVHTQFTVATSLLGTFYLRFYLRATSAPTSTFDLVLATSGTTTIQLRTDGGIDLLANGASQGPSASICDGQWHRIELAITNNVSSQVTSVELRLDGTTVGSIFSGTPYSGGNNFAIGFNTAPGANYVINTDDLVISDSTGATNNTWPGNGICVVMCPISDNNRGVWVAGAAGTTNLFDAVDNRPPVGVADASTTITSQIKNQTATNPTSYDGNLATYTAAGVTGTINSIRVWDADGEDPSTGTKTGACSMVSNPVIAEPTAFNFGDDVGAQGTYLGNWRWHSTALVNTPTVTLGTAPVIRMRCISGSTTGRAACCCFLGAYVDYTPAPTQIPNVVMGTIQQQ